MMFVKPKKGKCLYERDLEANGSQGNITVCIVLCLSQGTKLYITDATLFQYIYLQHLSPETFFIL